MMEQEDRVAQEPVKTVHLPVFGLFVKPVIQNSLKVDSATMVHSCFMPVCSPFPSLLKNQRVRLPSLSNVLN